MNPCNCNPDLCEHCKEYLFSTFKTKWEYDKGSSEWIKASAIAYPNGEKVILYYE